MRKTCVSVLLSLVAVVGCSRPADQVASADAGSGANAAASGHPADAAATWAGVYEVDPEATYAKLAPMAPAAERQGIKAWLEQNSKQLPVLQLDPGGTFTVRAGEESFGGSWKLRDERIITTTEIIHGVAVADMTADNHHTVTGGKIIYIHDDGGNSTAPAMQAFTMPSSTRLDDVDPKGAVMRRR